MNLKSTYIIDVFKPDNNDEYAPDCPSDVLNKFLYNTAPKSSKANPVESTSRNDVLCGYRQTWQSCN